MPTGSRIVALVLFVVYGVFWIWYGGAGAPLTGDEASELIERLESRAGEDVSEPEILDAFRELVVGDDGAEFYMVNLMRFREKAVYPPGHDYDDDVQAAADRYSAAVLPALLKRGSLPILLADPVGTFLEPEDADRWDQVGIVRYRSRRDMLEMAIELADEGSGVHKWASIEKTHVFPAQPVFDFVFVRGAVAAVLVVLGVGLHLLLLRRG